ncbi:MAG: RHS repeat-associated core domain-containing protein, partial [Planctomycetota bacterium]
MTASGTPQTNCGSNYALDVDGATRAALDPSGKGEQARGSLNGTCSAIKNTRLFTGREYDPETGLYHYRTRYYDPIIGRFISRDTIGVWGDWNEQGNATSFVANNPYFFLDPFGLEGKESWHHMLVQSQQEFFESIEGVHINDKEWGRIMPTEDNRYNDIHRQYNQAWDKQIE